MQLSVLLLMVAVLALAFTNPAMGDFETFAEAHLETVLVREMGDSVLGRALAGAGAGIAGAHVERITERTDYVLYSLYTVDLDGSADEADDWRFLGIGGQFVELQRPASLREEP